jgi:hypothetical protein
MAIGDFNNAIKILERAAIENSRDIPIRTTLLDCYENIQEWNKALDQCKVIRNLRHQVADHFRMMRLFAQLRMFDEVEALARDFPIDSVEVLPDLQTLQREAYDGYKRIGDSLRLPLDSVYFHAASANFANYIESRKCSIGRELRLSDYHVAIGLLELSKNRGGYFLRSPFTSALSFDSSALRFFRKPVLDYIASISKPEPRLFSSFYPRIRDYHQKRAELYEIIGDFQAAIDEYSRYEFWFEADNHPYGSRSEIISIHYFPRLALLFWKTKQYEKVIEQCERLQKKYGSDPLLSQLESQARKNLSFESSLREE